jgi:hypothetical protein
MLTKEMLRPLRSHFMISESKYRQFEDRLC